MSSSGTFRQVEPVITQRPLGGYLATSAPGSSLSIGVVGATEDEARSLFYDERDAWAALSERDDER